MRETYLLPPRPLLRAYPKVLRRPVVLEQKFQGPSFDALWQFFLESILGRQLFGPLGGIY